MQYKCQFVFGTMNTRPVFPHFARIFVDVTSEQCYDKPMLAFKVTQFAAYNFSPNVKYPHHQLLTLSKKIKNTYIQISKGKPKNINNKFSIHFNDSHSSLKFLINNAISIENRYIHLNITVDIRKYALITKSTQNREKKN